MGWKFSSSCHIDSSFSERNLPITRTSSKRALGSSSQAHSKLIPGLLRGQRRSSLQHLDSQRALKTAQLTENWYESAERKVHQHALSPHGEKKGNLFCNTKFIAWCV